MRVEAEICFRTFRLTAHSRAKNARLIGCESELRVPVARTHAVSEQELSTLAQQRSPMREQLRSPRGIERAKEAIGHYDIEGRCAFKRQNIRALRPHTG